MKTTPQLLSQPLGPQTAIIRDIIIGLQFDQCTKEACPSLRLLIDLAHESKVIKLDTTTLKNLKGIYKERLAAWIGQKVSVHEVKGRDGVCLLPIL